MPGGWRKKNVKHREIDAGAFYNRTKQNETSFHTRVHVFDLSNINWTARPYTIIDTGDK